MIIGYFGIPGCGKTTMLAKIAHKRRIRKQYKKIYTINVDIEGTDGKITKEIFEQYRFNEPTLILWDEISLDYDNRDFKKFNENAKESFLLHRHMNVDIIWSTQNYDKVDLKVRDLTLELWYIDKPVFPILNKFSIAKRIYRKININENTSELTLGYRFCTLLESILISSKQLVYRPKYYKYYNSWDLLALEKREIYEKSNNNYYNFN